MQLLELMPFPGRHGSSTLSRCSSRLAFVQRRYEHTILDRLHHHPRTMKAESGSRVSLAGMHTGASVLRRTNRRLFTPVAQDEPSVKASIPAMFAVTHGRAFLRRSDDARRVASVFAPRLKIMHHRLTCTLKAMISRSFDLTPM